MSEENLIYHNELKSLFKQKMREENPEFRYYKSIFNMTTNLVFVTDGCNIIDANKSFTDFFEEQNIDIYDEHFNISNLFLKIDKYGYVYDGYKNKRWFEVAQSRDRDYHRVSIYHNGELRQFNILIKHFQETSNIFVVILSDISEIMSYRDILEQNLQITSKNEEESKSLLKQYNHAMDISNIVMKVDNNGNINYVNDEFCNILKYEKGELIGSNIKILCNPNVTYPFYDSIIKTIQNGNIYKGVIENIDKAGEVHFFNTTIVPIKSLAGVTIEYTIIQNEITQMVIAKREALEMLESKTKFFDRVSHELRTPLNAIINFTDLSLDSFDEICSDEEAKESVKMYLERAYKNSQNLLNLINSLLDLSKVKFKKESFNSSNHDIVKLVRDTYENTYSLNAQKYLDYKLHTEIVSGTIKCDAAKFNQILVNLISNAFKFTNEGFIHIKIGEDKENYFVEIQDSGIGIPEQKLSSIFEPFEQARDTDAGTGLGLNIVKEYIEAMGMQLNVTSKEQSGSSFKIKIKKEVI